MHIIDRRLNPGGKSLDNRQRFLRRVGSLVRKAVHDASKDRGIRDIEQEGEVRIPIDGVREPRFRAAGDGGRRHHVLPGNKEYLKGDTIPRPKWKGGAGREGGEGDAEDEFRFVLTREEYLDLFLDDLELPDLAKRRLTDADEFTQRRAGFRTTGPPASLAVPRTMRNALARRVALRRPRPEERDALVAAIAALEASGEDPERLADLRAQLVRLDHRTQRIGYIDPLDIRYRRFERVPKPVAQAVVFCLMDVSGSMTEHMKDLAKRFFALLYIFLTRRYSHVEVVFIRHTHKADEVDEHSFFHSTESGGTVVSTALDAMARIVADRYPPADWNIYGAQASDGDNMSTDESRTAMLLQDRILPLCQYFAYIEVAEDDSRAGGSHATSLWRSYASLRAANPTLAMRQVSHRREIFPVFRQLFGRDARHAETGA
jgi:uncharacterized sporulation protein YeaH/YhbH (DUF444 family)